MHNRSRGPSLVTIGWYYTASLVLAGVLLSAQQPAPPPASTALASQTPTFTLGVNDVDVDVVVTDKQGRAVRGLAQSDFQVFEDGRPQEISTFSSVEIPFASADRPAATSTPPPDVVSNTQSFDGRLYVMVIDDLHTQPGEVLGLKAVAQQFVRDDFGATDLMAVIHTARPAGNQTFTNDKQRLVAAIDRASGVDVGRQLSQGDGYSSDQMQASDARSTLGTLQSVVGRLANIKTRRKAILFLSGGIDYDVRNLVPDDGAHALMNVEPGARTSSNQWGTAVMDAMRAAIDAAMRANVAVYSIDPRGLAAPGGLAQDSLRAMAEETGGSAIVGRNDFGRAFQRIVADNSAYYVLAYTGTDRRDGKFHAIDVRVNRPGVTVRARRGYLAPSPSTKSTPEKADESAWIRDALDDPIPLSNVTLDLFAAPFKGTPTEASVLVGTELRGRDLELTGGGDTVQIAYEAVDATGKTFGARTETVTLNLKPETQARIEQTGIRLLNRMNLPPGNYQLRVAARDGSGRLGSVFKDLVVPDFSKPLMLSGIVLTSTTASDTPTPKADDALRQVLPAPPGALRAFPQTDTLAFYAEAYDNEIGGPRRTELTATITDSTGRVLLKKVEAHDVADNAGRAGLSVQTPLTDLPAGPYVLSITAGPAGNGTASSVARRIPFVVVNAPTATSLNADAVAAVVPCCPNAAAYDADVRAFAHGDRGAAAIAIARAPAGELKRAISSLDNRDPNRLEAAAALHLALTWRALEENNIEESHKQFRISEALFQKIGRPSDNPAFVGAWYLASVEICLAAAGPAQCTALAERGVDQRVAPALTYLAAGIVYETVADVGPVKAAANSPQNGGLCRSCPALVDMLRDALRSNPTGDYAAVRTVAVNLNRADHAYREALLADSTSEEARLRLGRVLSLKGNDVEARTELESVLHQTHDARIGYLAHLFLAQLAVRRNDVETAAGEYSAAIAAEPSSRAPYVGLSSLALLAGNEARARESIREWTTRAPSSALDPWTTYRPGLDQLQSMLDSLLTMISQ